MCSEAMPRVIGSRSSAQNCSEVIAAFQMVYSHANSQYSAVSMVVVVKFLLNSNGSSINNMSEKFCMEYILV